MSDPIPYNMDAFRPYQGGLGKRISVTSATSRVSIPGFGGGTEDTPLRRVYIRNGGDYSAFVRMGQSDIVATTDCLEIGPGEVALLRPPIVGPSGVWLAAIALDSDSGTTINVCGGEGT